MVRSNRLACVFVLAAMLAVAPGPGRAEDKIKDLLKSTGFIEIKLIEAHVPDLDPLPMQRDSDVFARVYLNDTKQLVCETPVVQDDNTPNVSTSLFGCLLSALSVSIM